MSFTNTTEKNRLRDQLQKVCAQIAPVWSLENFVAVNPYMGLSDSDFNEAMIYLRKTAAHEATLPLIFYLEALKKGDIEETALEEVLKGNNLGVTIDKNTFLTHAFALKEEKVSADVPTVMDLFGTLNQKNWKALMVERVSSWAAAYFDFKYAAWNTSQKSQSIYTSWKREAQIDRTAGIMGMKGFRKFLAALPSNPYQVIDEFLRNLDLTEEGQSLYLHSVLMSCSGWASAAAKIDYDAKMNGDTSDATQQFLAILLTYEYYFFVEVNSMESNSKQQIIEFEHKIESYTSSLEGLTNTLAIKLLFQQAYDKTQQHRLIQKINSLKGKEESSNNRPELQSVFCIDVRSELMRRNLEAHHNSAETIGFAGFFAFPIEYIPLAHEKGNEQCPVLLKPAHVLREGSPDEQTERKAVRQRSVHEQLLNAWKSFKLGAISCFSFVGPVGLAYLPKLFTDSFKLSKPVKKFDAVGISTDLKEKLGVNVKREELTDSNFGIPLAERIDLAKNALTAMSLTDNFARLVMITGHGSTSVNNPHASGLDCGACGGNSGEINAIVAAEVLNEEAVREGLNHQGIKIPNDTLFLAALHDTTTDEVKLLNEGKLPASHLEDLKKLHMSLDLASKACRAERSGRFKDGDKTESSVLERSKDWSQVRPEWGLAGCSSFIVAPRKRTAALNLNGKAFMHSYDWQKDKDFGVLELIMTAPMVVASWINLQYYASTVDNRLFGSGNKTLHNVVAGMGVQEGIEGDLRVGLPWQSVHDGTDYQHKPERLAVFIEAPVDEISKIIAKHPEIQNLFDNQWLFLYALNPEGQVRYRYSKNLEWDLI